MRFALLILMMLCAAPALAGDLVLKNKDTGAELRLYETPCSHGETLAVLRPEWREKFKNARIRDKRGVIQFYGCWIEQADGKAAVVLSDGATEAFDMAAFADPNI